MTDLLITLGGVAFWVGLALALFRWMADEIVRLNAQLRKPVIK